jgi:GDP-4-dehydro-6-deoxy-D-mannose reductase
MKRVLVTGDRGFTGRHLTEHLRRQGVEVSGLGRSNGGDIRDMAAVRAVVQAARPDVVFHLAAAPRAADPAETWSINVDGTTKLLDAVLELDQPPVVVLVSSSAVYGRTSDRPIGERTEPQPITHYGASKLAAEEVARRYVRAKRLPVIRVRTFNLLGPGLSRDLAPGAFAAAVAHLEHRPTPAPIRTGNLASWRDYTDVRDAVRAYALLAERGRAGSVYNVCSGKAVSLDYCLRTLIGLAARPLATELDPARLQANDVPTQVGDPRRLRRLTGWEPRISVEQSLADMLDYERRKGGHEGNRSGGRQGDEARAVHDRLSEAARTDR